MKRTTLLSLLAVTALLILTIASPPLVMAQEDSNVTRRPQPPQAKTFNLDFKGGTIQAYVDSIMRVYKTANIIVMPEAADIPVPSFKLNSVNLSTAMELLDHRESRFEGQKFRVNIEQITGRMRGSSSEDVFTVSALIDLQPMETQVHSVQSILNDDFSSDDLMTAIESTLDILNKEFAPAQIRFHAQSGILIINAHPNQVQLVQNLLSELNFSHEQKRSMEQAQSRNDDKLQEAEQMMVKNATLQDEIAQLHFMVTTSETRHSILDQDRQRCLVENQKLKESNHDLTNQLHQMALINEELQSRLTALLTQVDALEKSKGEGR